MCRDSRSCRLCRIGAPLHCSLPPQGPPSQISTLASPGQALLSPVEAPLKSALGALGGLLASLPDLRVPVSSVSPSSWLLNTYLGGWEAMGGCV